MLHSVALQGDDASGMRDLAFHARLRELALQAGNTKWAGHFSLYCALSGSFPAICRVAVQRNPEYSIALARLNC